MKLHNIKINTVSRPLHFNPLFVQAVLEPYWMPFLGATDVKQKGMYEQRDVFVRYSSEPSFAILRNEYQACLTYISPTFSPACEEEDLNSAFCPDTFDTHHKYHMPQNTSVVRFIHLSAHPFFSLNILRIFIY